MAKHSYPNWNPQTFIFSNK